MQDESSSSAAAAAVSFCPSFSSYSCDRLADVAAASALNDDEFEFVCADPDAIEAGDHQQQQLAPPVFFPVFNRDRFVGDSSVETVLRPLSELFMADRERERDQEALFSSSSSSSEADELEGAEEGSYCVWTPKLMSPSSVTRASPSPGRCEKSNSTGSSASAVKRRWRLRDLLRRSSSDGKVCYLMVQPNSGAGSGRNISKDEKSAGVKKEKRSPARGTKAAASAHEVFYTKSRALRDGDRRRSYLPYRQELLVGFFSNVNGFSRTLTPF